MRVLIVDDEELLADSIRRWLAAEAIAADVADDGDAALLAIDVNDYDVVVLDRDLPGLHGDEVCRILVARPERPAILMLTAARSLDDTVEGLRLGADDYLTKPFELAELTARLRTLTRRRFTALPPILRAGDLTLDPYRREVYRAGRFVHLSRKEFAVLELLLRAQGGVLSAETLLEKAWDENADPLTNSVKVTISTLRRKIGAPAVIRTVPGTGYAIDGAQAHERG
ncbi:two-component system response regulator VanR [Salana multivorans]|uniref:Two-component system response regulator VanR n=1 Tax=Salana multivorans TaxID=120377 RepID=A0A3N2DCP1_9MICO|nr:response regulator transcription factor [Salana multivorans]OJX97933.1 MAG: DNA-binding response regulator [Micrococcales bacterium 73-15]ROR97559.1 two-component system response regulator VanR [Salana multivorans]